MQIAKPIQDLLTNWTRSKDLFTYIPKAQQEDYIRLFSNGVIA